VISNCCLGPHDVTQEAELYTFFPKSLSKLFI